MQIGTLDVRRQGEQRAVLQLEQLRVVAAATLAAMQVEVR